MYFSHPPPLGGLSNLNLSPKHTYKLWVFAAHPPHDYVVQVSPRVPWHCAVSILRWLSGNILLTKAITTTIAHNAAHCYDFTRNNHQGHICLLGDAINWVRRDLYAFRISMGGGRGGGGCCKHAGSYGNQLCLKHKYFPAKTFLGVRARVKSREKLRFPQLVRSS